MVLVMGLIVVVLIEAIEEEGERRREGTFVVRCDDETPAKDEEGGGGGGVGVREPDKPPRSRRSTVVAGTTCGAGLLRLGKSSFSNTTIPPEDSKEEAGRGAVCVMVGAPSNGDGGDGKGEEVANPKLLSVLLTSAPGKGTLCA